MKSDDVTAKQASTEEESRVEDEDDTSIEEESDTDSGRAWSVESEEEEGVVRPPNYLNMQDPEPEWDVDSFDGYECYDSEDHKNFSDEEEYEEFRQLKIQAWKNRGFCEEDPFRSIYPIINLENPWTTETRREYLAEIASVCVNKLNEEKGSSVEFVSVVRGNLKAGGGWKLYITFMAREYPNGPLVEYQAKAMDFAREFKPPFPILCRPAPN